MINEWYPEEMEKLDKHSLQLVLSLNYQFAVAQPVAHDIVVLELFASDDEVYQFCRSLKLPPDIPVRTIYDLQKEGNELLHSTATSFYVKAAQIAHATI
jgi:L-arabinose isomerase